MVPILFSEVEMAEDGWMIHHFSVASQPPAHNNIKARVIVAHTGRNDGSGDWECWQHRRAVNCYHINRSRDTLRQIVERDIDAHDPNAIRGQVQYLRKEWFLLVVGTILTVRADRAKVQNLSYGERISILSPYPSTNLVPNKSRMRSSNP